MYSKLSWCTINYGLLALQLSHTDMNAHTHTYHFHTHMDTFAHTYHFHTHEVPWICQSTYIHKDTLKTGSSILIERFLIQQEVLTIQVGKRGKACSICRYISCFPRVNQHKYTARRSWSLFNTVRFHTKLWPSEKLVNTSHELCATKKMTHKTFTSWQVTNTKDAELNC